MKDARKFNSPDQQNFSNENIFLILEQNQRARVTVTMGAQGYSFFIRQKTRDRNIKKEKEWDNKKKRLKEKMVADMYKIRNQKDKGINSEGSDTSTNTRTPKNKRWIERMEEEEDQQDSGDSDTNTQ